MRVELRDACSGGGGVVSEGGGEVGVLVGEGLDVTGTAVDAGIEGCEIGSDLSSMSLKL